MELKDILDLDKTLLDPKVSYGDTAPLSMYYPTDSNLKLDFLYLNAKYKNGKNLYEEFIKKHYYLPLFGNIFKDKRELEIMSCLPTLIFAENEQGRIIKFDLSTCISTILSPLPLLDYKQEVLYNLDDEEKIKYFHETLRTERNKLIDIQKKGTNSPYYQKLKDYIFEHLKDKNVSINDVINNYINGEIERITNLIFGCRYLKDFFDKEIDKNELISCFDFDTFAALCAMSNIQVLMAGMNMYDSNKKNPFNAISSPVNYLYHYFEALKKMREYKPNYNCTIKMLGYEIDKIISVNTDELIHIYNTLLKKHPEFSYKDIGDIDKLLKDNNITDDEISGMNKRELSNLIRNLISFDETDSKDIEAELKELTALSAQTIDPTEKNKIQQLIDKIEFLLANKPVKFIKGKGTFKNYYGYVYPNGYVVLDTIDKNYKKSYGNAMYMMPLTKLNDYSDSKKKVLRNNTNEVEPIEHRGNWKEKILAKLSTKNPLFIDITTLDSDLDISTITSIEELEKLKGKLQFLDTKTQAKIIEKQKHLERQRQIENLTKIDEEIKSTVVAPELYPSEKNELLDAESELLDQIDEKTDFITIHELSKSQKNKPQRNADVSLQTKLRTKDSKGFLHCDFCGNSSNEENIYQSNKSTRMFETHHIIPISDGGIDNLYNTACLCPGCHTRIHNYLRLRKKLSQGYEMNEEDFGEYINISEYGAFLNTVRRRIASSTPAYLPKFDELFDPNYNPNKNNLSEEALAEYYTEHKEEEDLQYAINWNNNRIK